MMRTKKQRKQEYKLVNKILLWHSYKKYSGLADDPLALSAHGKNNREHFFHGERVNLFKSKQMHQQHNQQSVMKQH